jgi:hypothetical protein
MPSRQGRIRALLTEATTQVQKIEKEYNKSLRSRTIDLDLRIDIKNVCENLRSSLDYLAADVRERHCPDAPAFDLFYFPILPNKKAFDARVDQWFPGLWQSAPAVASALEAVQPFQVQYEWLGLFNRVNVENKHHDLVAQTRVETQQTRVTGQGREVSWTSGVPFRGDVSVMGAPIDPKTQLPSPRPSIGVERITWVDFQFAGLGVSTLGLLKQALAGIGEIEATLRPLL